jgi:hypothetical protein
MGSLADVWKTYKLIWIEATALFIVYLCTLICFPGLILQTRLSFMPDESWFQVFMLALYALADISGRFLANYLCEVR